ncbi:MAG: DM13 domain-containing protein, partial [Gammaproteobacteria bacterium]|nr:DM13 domain-containing protein [Gammaproteobacteria bacterium]
LKGNVGNQNYEVPLNIRPESYGSVVIWCELFDVLFSSAPMNVT